MVNKPNFLIVGVPKAGTSSLYNYLKEHSEIYLPEQKELHYFIFDQLQKNTQGPGDKLGLSHVIKTKEEYQSLYNDIEKEKRFGDISPSYFYFSKTAIPLIKEYLGDDIKIIITLRNPIDRAFSNFLHQKRVLFERLSFNDALAHESNRELKGFGDFWRYKAHSLYYQNCKNYIDAFGSKNVKIILFEDLKTNTEREVKSIYKFLNVDESFTPSNLNIVFNKGGVYKQNRLTKFLLKPSRLKQGVEKLLGKRIANKYKKYKENILHKNAKGKPEISEVTIEELKVYFKSDIEQLNLLGVDTSKWQYFN